MPYTRSYQLQHAANLRKQEAVRALLPHYRKALQRLFDHNLRLLQEGRIIKPRWLTAAEMGEAVSATVLSQRYLKSVSNHANQIFASHLSSLEICVRGLISNSRLSDEAKRELYVLNKRHQWYSAKNPMMRRMMKHALKSTHYPRLNRITTMLLDGTVGQVQQAKQQSEYPYWVRISTLTSHKTVLIPLRANAYFERKPGRLANFVQVQVLPDEIKFQLVKHSDSAAPKVDGSVLGLDYGMVNLFTDSQGSRYGQALYPWLQEVDEQLEALTKQLQKQGVPLKTNKRYQAFQHRIREYVKNEVNRTLNTVASRASTLVFEKLDFRHGGLSKRMNRLLTRMGRSAVRQKLKALLEEQGVQSASVNAAYTSQECSGCGFVDRKNRLSQDKFKCLFCGKTLHADVNGARVIEKRFLDENIFAYTKRATIKQALDRIHRQRWNLPLTASISTA